MTDIELYNITYKGRRFKILDEKYIFTFGDIIIENINDTDVINVNITQDDYNFKIGIQGVFSFMTTKLWTFYLPDERKQKLKKLMK